MGDTFMKTWGQTDPKSKYEEFENLENVQKIDFQGKQYYFFYFRMGGNNGSYKWILPMVLDKGNLVVGKYSGPYNMLDSYFVDKENGLHMVFGKHTDTNTLYILPENGSLVGGAGNLK